jgi:alpha-galactosidase
MDFKISNQSVTPDVDRAADTVSKTMAPSRAPRINGPSVFGVRPGRPILYSIPATGDRPMQFSAEQLPAGVTLDGRTGALKGSVATRGSCSILLRATNDHGSATRTLRVEVGDRHTLTPPMGWNSWNCWGGAVDQGKVLDAAKAMVDSGLQNHGWTYINIDDGWQGTRGGSTNSIQPNRKFPDIHGLADSIHALGLKFGIYSTPWRGTYEGHIGSSGDHSDGTYPWIVAGDCNEFFRIGKGGLKDWDAERRQHYAFGNTSFVQRDIEEWVRWGIDYLKYDWKLIDVEHCREIYECLQRCDRDVALSLSNKAPFSHAKEWARMANCWRTTADIEDSWESVKSIGFNQDRWNTFAGPGHWNDPDMLVVGQVGWGPNLRPTRLTESEQVSHVSLWCLLSAPLLIGCDLSKLDRFTLSLLTNDEVIAVDQDPLGAQGVRVAGDANHQIVVKPLEDGSLAIGLFNLQDRTTTVEMHWDDLLISGPRLVRDLWCRADEGSFEGNFSASVAAHGVKLIRLISAAGSGS